jgi:hypothetical protein
MGAEFVRRLGWILLLICCPAGAGCCLETKCMVSSRPDVPRRRVTYESEAAERLFACTLDKLRQRALDEETSRLVVGLVCFGVDAKKCSFSEDAFFNDEVARCDMNRDGIISNAEAAAHNKLAFRETDLANQQQSRPRWRMRLHLLHMDDDEDK